MKVVIAHVPAGSGHQRAAEAVYSALHTLSPSSQVTLLDSLRGFDACYRSSFTQGYLGLIDQAPALWGLSYHLTDCAALSGAVRRCHRLSNKLHAGGLEKILSDLQPDVFVSTHFTPSEVAVAFKSRRRPSMRVITVITDYLPHTLWIAPSADAYVVGSHPARERLMARGVPGGAIHLLGIPIDPKFARKNERLPLAKRLGLSADRFTILVGSGGAGTGPVTSIIHALNQIQKPIQILAVAGKNTNLFKKLEALRPKLRHPMRSYGFIQNMDELMDLSDLLVSKPGGLTCAESMAKGLPLLMTAPIPGQEAHNAGWLEGMGAALWVRRLSQLPREVEQLIQAPDRLQEIGRRARAAGFPDAALQVARLALGV